MCRAFVAQMMLGICQICMLCHDAVEKMMVLAQISAAHDLAPKHSPGQLYIRIYIYIYIPYPDISSPAIHEAE